MRFKKSILVPIMMFAVPAAVIAAGQPVSTPPRAKDFHWNGTLERGQTIEVRGVYGSIRSIPSTDGSIHVKASIHDSGIVRVDVVHDSSGITICTITSTPGGEESECQPREHRTNDAHAIDQRVNFEIQVPLDARFAASMIHGDIAVGSLSSDVHVATIDGNITLEESPDHGAEFYGNTVSGTIDSDFRIYESVPPPSMDGSAPPPRSSVSDDRHYPRIVRATIGNGGPALVVSTISGHIRLQRSDRKTASEP